MIIILIVIIIIVTNRTSLGRLGKRNSSSLVENCLTRSLRSLLKYFSTLEEKFRICARPCNILCIMILNVLFLLLLLFICEVFSLISLRLYSNRAACHLQLKQYKECVQDCSSVRFRHLLIINNARTCGFLFLQLKFESSSSQTFFRR